LKWDQPEAFFDRLAVKRAKLPSLDGEIYLEYHRGTFTTQSRVKSHFRALERALQAREAALVVTGKKPGADLAHAWRRLVFAQFHDYIPGSSIPEVYAQGLPELAKITREQTEAASMTLSGPKVGASLLATSGRSVATKVAPTRKSRGDRCLFNPLPLARQVVVNGRVVALPPLAGVRIADATVKNLAPVTVKGRTLSNGRVTARLDARGGLAALTVDGRAIELIPGAGSLMVIPEQPANFGPWDIDRHSLSLAQPARVPATITADRAGFTVSRKLGRASTASIRYWLEPGASVLRVTVSLDWHEEDTMLKLRFPTAYRGREVRCGTPFGSVLRPQLATSPQVEAQWEWPMSRWATVSHDGERAGLFVVTEAKYGLSCRDGDLAVTLLRSPRHVGFEEHAKAYPAHLSRLPKPATVFTDQGQQTIELALGAYDLGAPRAEQPAALAETLFTAPIAYRGAPVTSAFRGLTGGETLIPHWAQPQGRNQWLLRLHEVAGQRGTAKLDLAPGWTAQKTNLLGEPLAPILRSSKLSFAPYEIMSLQLSR
jgi:alpha-mannosidase